MISRDLLDAKAQAQAIGPLAKVLVGKESLEGGALPGVQGGGW